MLTYRTISEERVGKHSGLKFQLTIQGSESIISMLAVKWSMKWSTETSNGGISSGRQGPVFWRNFNNYFDIAVPRHQ